MNDDNTNIWKTKFENCRRLGLFMALFNSAIFILLLVSTISSSGAVCP